MVYRFWSWVWALHDLHLKKFHYWYSCTCTYSEVLKLREPRNNQGTCGSLINYWKKKWSLLNLQHKLCTDDQLKVSLVTRVSESHGFHHSDIWLYLLLCHKFVLGKKLPVPIGSTLGHIVLPLLDFRCHCKLCVRTGYWRKLATPLFWQWIGNKSWFFYRETIIGLGVWRGRCL